MKKEVSILNVSKNTYVNGIGTISNDIEVYQLILPVSKYPIYVYDTRTIVHTQMLLSSNLLTVINPAIHDLCFSKVKLIVKED